MTSGPEPPALEALRARLDEEEAAYAAVLAAVDRLCAFPLPAEAAPEIHDRRLRLNELWPLPDRPAGGGLAGAFRRRAWDAVAPALERQSAFNAALVQLANAYLAQADAVHARLRELAGALVRYAQRVQPLVDARDRVATALATTRSELLLEAFDRRLESLGRRLEGQLAPRDRAEDVSEEAGFVRGSRDEVRRRLAGYAERLAGCAPVVDLGCGRGELLEALRDRGVAARGVEANARAARECRERGLDVVEGDLVDVLRRTAEGSLGAVVAVQVAEHLPPPVLSALLAQAHRALRPGGLLLLESVNPRSVLALFEVYDRDLTPARPLPPDALGFLAAAAGFSDVRVEMPSPVPPDAQLQGVPADGLPPAAAAALNENVARLNALLYGPLEYALLARR